jgi:predicted nucleotidyltransferase
MEGDKVLADVVKKALFLFDGRLVSVVLFGSRARGTARQGSDIDLLIVVRALPGPRERARLALDFAEIGFDHNTPIQVLLAAPEETELSAETGAPLMFEIHDCHRIFYDAGDFFRRVDEAFTKRLQEWKARKIGDRIWEVPGLAATRLP